MSRRIILVTGCPRSGTTAVGDYLAEAPGAACLYEPFNFHSGVRAIRRYFEIPGAGGFGVRDLDQVVAGIRALKLDLKVGIFPEDGWIKRLRKLILGGRSRISYWRCRLDPGLRTVIWKDPIAALAASTLAERHEIPVLVTVREPLAVAASFKRLGWAFQVRDIAARLHEAGVPVTAWPKACDDRLDTPAVNAGVLWAIVYSTLLRCSCSSRFHFVDIEDVVRRPVETYRALYRALDLSWTESVERRIRHGYTSVRSASNELPRRPHVRRRDLSAVNSYGRDALTADERDLVTASTVDVWAAVQAHPDRVVVA
jgi:hypothetical protein